VATGLGGVAGEHPAGESPRAREPQKRRAKALPGPLHLKGETQVDSTPNHAGLILNGRIALISRLLSCGPSHPPPWAWFEPAGAWGTTMPLVRDSPSRQGMSLARTPPGLPLPRRLPRRGSLVGGSGGGLPCQARSARRSVAAPASGRAWSTFGPHAIGAQRFVAVSSGLQRCIVRPGRRCHPGETGPWAEP